MPFRPTFYLEAMRYRIKKALILSTASAVPLVTSACADAPSRLPTGPNPVAVHSIEVDADSMHFSALGEAQSLAIRLLDSTGEELPITLATREIENPKIASVESDGTMRSHANGTTNILIRAGDKRRTVPLVVRQKVTSVRVFPWPLPEFNAVGDSIRLYTEAYDIKLNLIKDWATKVIWKTDDPTTIEIDQATGTMRLLRSATAYIWIEVPEMQEAQKKTTEG